MVLELAINARGGVDSVTVAASCGFPELDAAAARAASRAHFTPAKAGRTAIPSTARLTITFKLHQRDESFCHPHLNHFDCRYLIIFWKMADIKKA